MCKILVYSDSRIFHFKAKNIKTKTLSCQKKRQETKSGRLSSMHVCPCDSDVHTKNGSLMDYTADESNVFLHWGYIMISLIQVNSFTHYLIFCLLLLQTYELWSQRSWTWTCPSTSTCSTEGQTLASWTERQRSTCQPRKPWSQATVRELDPALNHRLNNGTRLLRNFCLRQNKVKTNQSWDFCQKDST